MAQGAARPDPGCRDLTLRVAWVGPFQPTLEQRWLDVLAGSLGPEALGAVWLLVPSPVLGQHLLGLAARARGAVNLHALTFTELADRVLAGRAARRLPPVGDVLVLRQAIGDAVPDDGYFGAVREASRFPGALAATFAELRTAGVGAIDLARAARETSGASAAKLRELARILEHADVALGRSGFAHPTDALWTAAAHVASAPTVREPAALLTYGFTEWNAAERALVRALAARVPTTCFVPGEPGPPFEPVDDLVTWLGTLGFRIARAEPPHRTGLPAVVARLFRTPTTPTARPRPPEVAGLEVVAAPGEEREVREIARRILAAAAEGVPLDTVGVLLRHPEAYRTPIRDVFGAAGIPYTWGGGSALRDTRAGRSLRLLLATRREGFARAAVVEFLATAPLRSAASGDAAEWDRLTREAGIVGGVADWRRGLARLVGRARAGQSVAAPDEAESPGPGPAVAVVERLSRVVGRLLAALAPLPERAPAATLARGLLRAFVRLSRRDDAEPIGALLATFQALEAIPVPLDLDAFSDLLDAALDAPAQPAPTPRRGRVFVGELSQALGVAFRVLFIPGLVEQSFPAPPRADPILLDAERALLHAQLEGGRPGLRLATHRPAEERLLFRLAAAAAEERLVLTYPRVDPQSGRGRVPSFFLLRIAEAATGRAFDFTRLERDFPPYRHVSLVPAPPAAVERPVDRREWLLAQAARARAAGAPGHAACLNLAPHAARGRAALCAREQSDRLSPWDGLLPETLGPRLAAVYRRLGAPVAATLLESYATCPFRYYLAHVLKLRPAVEPERVQTLVPVDRGRLLHAVLAESYLAFRDAGLLPLTPERLPAARAHLAAALERAEARFVTGLAPLWRGERARLLSDLQAALEAEARGSADPVWVPSAFEVGFGGSEGEPHALEVGHSLPDGRLIRLRGRLDRLDLSADGAQARVIDYKTGAFPGGAGSALRGGTALQLPIYRLAAEALCRAGGQAARVVEAQYYYLTRRGGRRRLAFTEADWAARRDDFDQALLGVLDGIARGRFFQNPSPDTCRLCDYPAACGAERERITWAERKLADPARADYARLQAIP
jgi:ATP-dependent helicase/nuclease subunit B